MVIRMHLRVSGYALIYIYYDYIIIVYVAVYIKVRVHMVIGSPASVQNICSVRIAVVSRSCVACPPFEI